MLPNKFALFRGMAVKDTNAPHGLRLLIEDYPYAVDGLKVWSAIETWVEDYCKFYYKNDKMVREDAELQSWWKELREEGHGDKKDEPWWPKMQTVKELTDTCTIVIWVASALHAAVNFGQYPYAGYLPNRPTLSRRFSHFTSVFCFHSAEIHKTSLQICFQNHFRNFYFENKPLFKKRLQL